MLAPANPHCKGETRANMNHRPEDWSSAELNTTGHWKFRDVANQLRESAVMVFRR